MISYKPTRKGLLRGEFLDRIGAICSLQESSIVEDSCLWLGVEVDFDGREVRNGRVLLSQEQALQLIPVLRHFARTGRVGSDGPEETLFVGRWVVGVGPDNKGVEGRIVEMDAKTIAVQSVSEPGSDGLYICSPETFEKFWEPTDAPDQPPTWHERIGLDAGD